MQARDVMTREVMTVGPNTSAKYAAEVMADRGFAALPVVDDELRLVGIVAEADVLRDGSRPIHGCTPAATSTQRTPHRRCSSMG